MERVSIIGSGNVASWFAQVGFHEGCLINQVYSRNIEHAKECAQWCMATPIDSLEELSPDSDIYIFAVKDDCLSELVASIPFKMNLAVHTSGSVSKNIFKGYARRYGVLYPCQSISKESDFTKLKVPLCVEGNSAKTEDRLSYFASYWSDRVYSVSEQQRFQLHLAAIFANNYINALYDIAYGQMEAAGLDWELLLPLIENTAKKVREMTPRQAQTGPARRGDSVVINKQLAALRDYPQLQEIYSKMTDYIISHSK